MAEPIDLEPWDMPLAGAMRPFEIGIFIRLILAGAFLFAATGSAGLTYALAADSSARHPTSFVALNLAAVALGLMLAVCVKAPPELLRRAAPAATVTVLFWATLVVTMGVWSAGPELGVTAVAYIEAPLFAFYMLQIRWAIAHAAFVLACWGLVVLVQDGWTAPFQAWLFAAANVIGTGVVVGQIAARNRALATRERKARAELAGLNHTLEDRVETQVAEIERLGALRRFLPHQVADIMLAEDSSALSEPHRAEIAVLFCDLRGFTAFTNSAEPEEVIAVLDEYYRAAGGLLQQHDATIGAYAGDGVMAYLGDPVPRENAAVDAVEMTLGIVRELSSLATQWQRSGYDLHYGVGLAFGYATLGVIGFDGRFDYTPIGGVVNLAARLCAHAAPGQVLLDHATYVRCSKRFPSDSIPPLDLKGYRTATRAYSLRLG